MATFDRFFKFALRDGQALITPKGTKIELSLKLYDWFEENKYGLWMQSGGMDFDSDGEFAEETGWAQADAAGVDVGPAPKKKEKKPKKIGPDSRGRYCLKISLLNGRESGSGFFYYLPKEQVIELDRSIPCMANDGLELGIKESELRRILLPFYDELPPIRLESN